MNKKKIEKQQLTDITTEDANTDYISLPQEKRFLVLYHFMKTNSNKKVIIYVSSPSFVQFCEEFTQVEGLSVLTIHEKQSKSARKKVFEQFREASASCVLICTDKAARNFRNLDSNFMVQYDPPQDLNEYIERLKRISASENCRCILFTIEEEMEFIRYLKSQNVSVELLDVSSSKLNNIQTKLEKLVKEKHSVYLSARQGYAGYVKAYRSHPNKEIFSISNINLTKVANSFGFRVPPFVDTESPEEPDQDHEEENQKRARNDDAQLAKTKKIKTIYKPVKRSNSKV